MMDYSKVTDEELNETVLRAKGWEKLPWPAVPPWQKPGFALFFPLAYSTDIAAAWELVEEMYAYVIKKIDPEVMAILYPEKNILTGQIGKDAKVTRAICIAYLAWKEA